MRAVFFLGFVILMIVGVIVLLFQVVSNVGNLSGWWALGAIPFLLIVLAGRSFMRSWRPVRRLMTAAGSLADGTIVSGDLRTGEVEELVPGGEGRLAVGMDYDARSGFLFVAGGTNGVGRVYDTSSGALVAEYGLAIGAQRLSFDDLEARDRLFLRVVAPNDKYWRFLVFHIEADDDSRNMGHLRMGGNARADPFGYGAVAHIGDIRFQGHEMRVAL